MAHKISRIAAVVLALTVNLGVVAGALAYSEQPLDGNGSIDGAASSSTVLGTFQEGSKLGGYENVAAEGPLLTAALIVNLLLTLLGSIAIALTVYAGFVWLKASGNEDEIKRAKAILTGSAIGLMLILSSYSITTYIFRSFVNITNEL